MTLARRIIPCLDVDRGRVVKGVQFRRLRRVGDPAELAERYEAEGADEIVFLDISASVDGRGPLLNAVRRTAKRLFIPLTVGGGVGSVEDMHATLRAGAEKVALNTAAARRPALITECAARFGRQCVVIAIDAKQTSPGKYAVYTHGGRRRTRLGALDWARRAASLGAGEILLTSMDADGTQNGYDLDLTRAVVKTVNVPVIASGGCGSPQDVFNVLSKTGVQAALAASIFHDGNYSVQQVKEYLSQRGVVVRC